MYNNRRAFIKTRNNRNALLQFVMYVFMNVIRLRQILLLCKYAMKKKNRKKENKMP